MVAEVDKTSPCVTVEVSEDRMQAWLLAGALSGDQTPTAEEVLGAMKSAKIAIDDQVREHVAAFVSTPTDDESKTEKVLIAKGTPPVEGRDGDFIWTDALQAEADSWQDDEDDGAVNYYTANMVVTVDKDCVIGKVVPPDMGKDGVDVLGRAIKPRSSPMAVQLTDTVKPSSDDPLKVISNVAGKIVFKEGKLSIDEVVDVRGDVDFESGSIQSDVNVSIRGTILDNFEVRSKRSITVGGAIEAAIVEAGEDLVVRGGTLGRDRGSVKAGGIMVTKFVAEGDLNVGGDLKIAKEVMNSRVHCEGTVHGAQAAVIGGDLYAKQGLEVATLGSDACVPTKICVGLHPDIIREINHIRESTAASKKAVEKIRETVQPLMANLKRLTSAQREAATELLFKADAAELEISETESRRVKILADGSPPKPPFVSVSKVIYPGVTIRIGGRQVVFAQESKEPVRIEERKIKNVTEIVAVNQLSGSITTLKSALVVEDEPKSGSSAKAETVGNENATGS